MSVTFFQGIDATVGDAFAPLGEPDGKGTDTQTDIATTRPKRPKGRFSENCSVKSVFAPVFLGKCQSSQ